MSLPSAPVLNSELSSLTWEDQPRCRKRVFSTAPRGPLEAPSPGPSGDTSRGGSSEMIPRGGGQEQRRRRQ